MTMKQLLVPEQYLQVINKINSEPDFATCFIEEHIYKSQQFHWYSTHIVNMTPNLNLLSNKTLYNK